MGTNIDRLWARTALTLTNSQSYHVSPFEPSPFYDDQPTLIYSAAIRSDNGRVAGGIGVVFYTAPQLQAMLSDSLLGMRDGSIAIFVTPRGHVLYSTGDHALGDHLGIDADLLSPPAEGLVRVNAIDGVYYVVGAHLTAGYREYRGLNVVAVVMIPLGAVDDEARGELVTRRGTQQQQVITGTANLELAIFWVADKWLGIPLADVIEAVDTKELHALPNKLRGQASYLMYAGHAVLVADLAALMGRERTTAGEVVLVRIGGGKTLGQLVDSLDDIPQVNASDVVKLLDMFTSGGVTEGVVRSQSTQGPLLLILSPDRVAALLTGQSLVSTKLAS